MEGESGIYHMGEDVLKEWTTTVKGVKYDIVCLVSRCVYSMAGQAAG